MKQAEYIARTFFVTIVVAWKEMSMRNAVSVVFASVLLAGAVMPSHAQDLLGNLLGGDGGGGLVTLGSGEASSGGLVNVGLGGGDGNLVDLNVGGSEGLATANISSGSGNGLLDANVDLLNDTVGVTANVGGDNLLGIGIAVGGSGNSGGPGGPGAPGNPGSPGNPGAPGNPGLPSNPGFSGSGVANSGGGAACDGASPNQIARLIRSTQVDASWMRASNVAIQRVQVCPEVRVWLSSQLAGSGLGPVLQNAVASDALISTSLGRSNYGTDRVFAVKRSGAQLTIYVY
ncbi:hypothetical protein [Devosia lacusdianchii]|uniref:hypothetical protein n=1 Tax=Devosia lacusdianchii TaxID=2917991 RepID=UPI001F068770|nr:hypothetical protein [Devosia sp. JXJ CY 41]